MKIALVHDWLNGMRGGEKVLEVICEIFPDAPIYTLFCDKPKLSKTLQERVIIPSILQRFPFVKSLYRYYLPFYVYAIERIDLTDFDLIISVNHSVAKGFKKRKDAIHICYCNTPMRYVWEFSDQYFGGGFKHRLIKPILNKLREWDLRSSDNVDYYIANSNYIKDRIKRCYGRDSDAVIYPPVDTDFFTPEGEPIDYYLAASALTPYKKMDIAVEAFNELGYPLRIIGAGPEGKRLKKTAKHNTVFLDWQDGEILRDYYRKCRAFIFPAEEDFGIIPLEAQACGRPVIAFGRGGAVETVLPHKAGYIPDGAKNTGNPTGIFFEEQTAQSLINAVRKFNDIEGQFDRDKIRQNSLRFDRKACKEKLKEFIFSRIGK